MNQDTIRILFALVRSAVLGSQLTEQEIASYDGGMLSDLMAISRKHDIAHMVSAGLKSNGLLTEENGQIENEILKAVYRYTRINYEYGNLCNALEHAKIPFLPLKGSVIRRYYREPWLRTSCDIDVLVHECDVDKAAEYLSEHCGYTNEGKNSHDISLLSSMQNHIELHYDLMEDGLIKKSSDVLKSVWDNATTREGQQYWAQMTDEMFYFYHIAHMAKHFENGGCGIRPFIDLWILDGIDGADKQKRDDLLLQGDLLKFAEAARGLGKVWFENALHDGVTKQMERYILQGGVYGTNENRIAVQQQKKGGRFHYALSKIFIPYDVIKFHYPVLQKHRFLTPIMEVRRWCKLLFCGHVKRSMRELRYNQSVSNADAESMRIFLNDIGL